MEPQVSKCKFCGRLYEVAPMMVGDQSVCPKCREEAQRNTRPSPFRQAW